MLTVNYFPKNSLTEAFLSISFVHVVTHSQIVGQHEGHCASYKLINIATANVAKNKNLKTFCFSKEILQKMM